MIGINKDDCDYDRLGGNIKKLSKLIVSPKDKEKEFVYDFLSHKDYYVRESAAYILFFIWNLSDKVYLDAALNIISDQDEDFDVRKWVFSSTPILYKQTNNIRILKNLLYVFRNDNDDLVKESSLRALLRIYGFTSKDILAEELENKIDLNTGTIMQKEILFASEISQLENLIKSNE